MYVLCRPKCRVFMWNLFVCSTTAHLCSLYTTRVTVMIQHKYFTFLASTLYAAWDYWAFGIHVYIQEIKIFIHSLYTCLYCVFAIATYFGHPGGVTKLLPNKLSFSVS